MKCMDEPMHISILGYIYKMMLTEENPEDSRALRQKSADWK